MPTTIPQLDIAEPDDLRAEFDVERLYETIQLVTKLYDYKTL